MQDNVTNLLKPQSGWLMLCCADAQDRFLPALAQQLLLATAAEGLIENDIRGDDQSYMQCAGWPG